MPEKKDKFADPYNPDGLSDEEIQKRAVEASNASLKDFDPEKVDDGDKVVETNIHASLLVKELADHPDPAVANDAKGAMEGTNPGGKHYPNGRAADQKSSKPSSDK